MEDGPVPMSLSRRLFLGNAALAGLAGLPAAAAPAHGGRLVVAIDSEPSVLTSALTTAGPAQYISGKIFDGLLRYDSHYAPQPQLAQSWGVSPDGLAITFRLRRAYCGTTASLSHRPMSPSRS